MPENLTRLMSSEEWRKVLDGFGEGALGSMGARPCLGKMSTFCTWRVCCACKRHPFPMPSPVHQTDSLCVWRTHQALGTP